MKKIVLSILSCLTIGAQNINQVQCWGSGGTSCYEYQGDSVSGFLYCSCAASCNNPPNLISAASGVYWYCYRTYCHGSVSGWAVGNFVHVDGVLGCTDGWSQLAWDEQDCQGNRSGYSGFGSLC